jgi:hypothetical protein
MNRQMRTQFAEPAGTETDAPPDITHRLITFADAGQSASQRIE